MKRLWLCLAVVACGGTTGRGGTPTPPGHSSDSDKAAEVAPPHGAGVATSPAADRSLYDRLGGLPAIKAVVEEFVGRTTTDARIKERFFNTDAVHLKAMLVEQICAATGGPCKYTGRDMKASHDRMELVDDEFTALVEDLVGALDKFKVPEREKGQLLGALAALKPDIVAPPDRLKPLDAARLATVSKAAAKLTDRRAAELLELAVVAGTRGQRSYAEQLFSRAELLVGPKPIAAIASVFREEAPPRIATPPKAVAADAAPQPKGAVGNSEDDEPRPAAPPPSTLTGKVTVDGAPLTGMAVVMLEPKGKHGARRVPKTRVMEQRDRLFAPHVLAVPVGSTVSFPNYDNVYHNVFSLSAPAKFDLGLYKTGETREVKINKEGIVRVGCNIHSAMAGFVIAVSAPHYAVADASGAFTFRRLSPGTYTVKAWSEQSAEPTTSEVVIKPGANELTVAVKADASNKNPDKFGSER